MVVLCLTEALSPQRCPLGSTVLKVKLLDMGEPRALLATALSPPRLGDIGRTVLLLKEVGRLVLVGVGSGGGERDFRDGFEKLCAVVLLKGRGCTCSASASESRCSDCDSASTLGAHSSFAVLPKLRRFPHPPSQSPEVEMGQHQHYVMVFLRRIFMLTWE